MITWTIKNGSQARGGTMKVSGPERPEIKDFRKAMRKASRKFNDIVSA